MKRVMKTAVLAMTMLIMCWPAKAQVYLESDLDCVVAYAGLEDVDSRDYITIRINHKKQLIWHGKVIGADDVRDVVKKSILNENYDPQLPTPCGFIYSVNKHKTCIRYTYYHLCVIKDATISANDNLLQKVLHEMAAAVYELRDEHSQKYFAGEYNQNSIGYNLFLQQILPCVIEWGEYRSVPLVPVVQEVAAPAKKVPTTEAVSKKSVAKDNMDEANSLVDEVLQSLQRYQEDTEEIAIDAPEECAMEEEEEVIFMVVESMPEFPGGQDSLFSYLEANVQYPVIAQENGIQGRVICQFVVNKDGSIVDVVVVRSSGEPSLDKEAMRVIKSMPRWKPGKQRGKPVRVKYTVPVNFRLE